MPKKEKAKLRVIPLGGLHEIGKNLTVLEYADDILISHRRHFDPEMIVVKIKQIVDKFNAPYLVMRCGAFIFSSSFF